MQILAELAAPPLLLEHDSVRVAACQLERYFRCKYLGTS